MTEQRMINISDLYNYKCSDRGLLLPIINEYTWAVEVRALLYLLGLLYCFLGIAIIADVFMCSIEKITSKTRILYLAEAKDNEPETLEVRIWNDTVANLTLMALGSSAPEILLSIIEIVGKNFESGELGPGTIVGSAAFNLFCITAVCIVVVPNGETRCIKQFYVFACTAFFSVFAYFWLLIILLAPNSPGEVELWEALVTFLFFPFLVVLAYMIDTGCCGLKKKLARKGDKQLELGDFKAAVSDGKGGYNFTKHGHVDREGLVNLVKEIKKYPNITDEEAATLAAAKLVENQPHSRMWYRIGAIRDISGGRKTRPTFSIKLKEV